MIATILFSNAELPLGVIPIILIVLAVLASIVGIVAAILGRRAAQQDEKEMTKNAQLRRKNRNFADPSVIYKPAPSEMGRIQQRTYPSSIPPSQQANYSDGVGDLLLYSAILHSTDSHSSSHDSSSHSHDSGGGFSDSGGFDGGGDCGGGGE